MTFTEAELSELIEAQMMYGVALERGAGERIPVSRHMLVGRLIKEQEHACRLKLDPISLAFFDTEIKDLIAGATQVGEALAQNPDAKPQEVSALCLRVARKLSDARMATREGRGEKAHWSANAGLASTCFLGLALIVFIGWVVVVAIK